MKASLKYFTYFTFTLALIKNVQAWVGCVTQLIPPNYGIVDGSAFYVHEVVKGGRLPQVWVENWCGGKK